MIDAPILNTRPVSGLVVDQLMTRPVTLAQRPVKQELTEDQKRALLILDPKLFAQHQLQVELWDVQAKILDALVTEPRIAVKACHASSKTFSAAIAVLWFLASHPDEAVVVTTAPTFTQVEKLLWGEVHAALGRSRYPFPKANLTELKINSKRYAYGVSTVVTKKDEGVRLQGFHAKNVLVILDEAPGVDPKIWEAIEGARAGGNVRVLALGNPTIASGPFHTAFTDNRIGWTCFTIDAFDTPNLKGVSLEQLLRMSNEELDTNVCPYLITRKWVKERYYEWGPGHPSWDSRVRGQFPKQSPNSLLSLEWLEQASIRELEEKETDEWVAGIDVAGPGEDETSLTIRKGSRVVVHAQTSESDPRGWALMQLAPYKDKLSSVNIDCIGIGWNFYLHIKDFGYNAVPINVCQSANDSDKYYDLKTEFFWGFRQRCQTGDFCGLTDDKTIGQLAGILYKPTPRGQIKVESKDEARERGVKSPDRAESVMLAFASKVLVFGALEFFKQQQKQAEEHHLKVEQKHICPRCSSVTCVVPNNNGLRCNQCGHQWILGEKKEVPVVTRAAILARMGRA